MDYDTLVDEKNEYSSIRGWVNNQRIPPETILTEAEAEIYAVLRTREMKSAPYTGSIAADDISISFPSDFIAAISLRRVGSAAGPIHILDSDYFETQVSVDDTNTLEIGVPDRCQIHGDPPVAYLNFKSDGIYPWRMTYWKRPAALSTNNPSNFLCVRYPTLLRTACVWRAYDFLKEYESRDKSETKFKEMVMAANREYDMGEAANRFEPYSESR